MRLKTALPVKKRNFREKEVVAYKPPAPTCGEDADFIPKELADCAKKALNEANENVRDAGEYISDSSRPYAAIALGATKGVGLGATVMGASLVGGTALLGRQALSDTKTVSNRLGAGAAAAESELEAQTIAYITGDNRRPPSKGVSTCPF